MKVAKHVKQQQLTFRVAGRFGDKIATSWKKNTVIEFVYWNINFLFHRKISFPADSTTIEALNGKLRQFKNAQYNKNSITKKRNTKIR